MGPLTGMTFIEMAGIGPGPFAGMLFADMGAKVISVDRSSKPGGVLPTDITRRGKYSIALNLKSAQGIEVLMQLIESADAVFEGFRPGVMERLGLGPEVCLSRNPKLVYGRMTGWGQTGPLSQAAGHDINYISLSGVLHAIGRAGERPVPPLNLVGDYGGGAMFLVAGMFAALLQAQRSGEGQVVDAAMTEGSSLLMSMFHSFMNIDAWTTERGDNILDGAAHFYDTYETSDGGFVSIGSIEPQFYHLLIEKAGLDPNTFSDQHNKSLWPDLKTRLAKVIKTKTRDEWCKIMEGSDVCFAPVLDMLEAQSHTHNVDRKAFIEVDGHSQPGPAPRFSATPSGVEFGMHEAGADTDDILRALGYSGDDVMNLRAKGALT
ncbi:MAG: CaiB/BaiF CoA-transferase family protein [Pseudomonadota bacterium]